jgi:xylan 1,4-beta-xylosidase
LPRVLASTVASAGPARFERFTYRGQAREAVAVDAGQFRHPILPGYYPDPSVTRVGGDYYLVNSSFAHFPGLPVFRSKDLVNRVRIGNAVDRSGQVDLSGGTISEGLFDLLGRRPSLRRQQWHAERGAAL